MIPQLFSSAKGRRCSETCLDLLAIQLVRYYQKQNLAPAAASIEAIGKIKRRHDVRVVMPKVLRSL